MSRTPDAAKQLLRSWTANASAWSAVVREQRIESRRVATDAAILEAVSARAPARVLDVGCGEGWLARALAASDIAVVGVDGSAPLIEAARGAGGGTFLVLSYDEWTARPERVGSAYDAIVCNYSLLEEEIVPLLSAMRCVAAPEAALLIQTVHPWTARGEAAYQNGWRTETFAGFGERFVEPMPWYFRTLESWVDVLHAAGWALQEVREPLHPETETPLSLLLVCGRAPRRPGNGSSDGASPRSGSGVRSQPASVRDDSTPFGATPSEAGSVEKKERPSPQKS